IRSAKHGGHRFQSSTVKNVQQKRDDDIVGVMAECDLVAAFGDRDVIQNSSPQTRTDCAKSFPFRHESLDDRISVFFDDLKGHTSLFEIVRQDVSWKSWLLLVEVYCEEIKTNRRSQLY